MNSGENSTFIEIGLVTKNLHYGLFASRWWHEATITSSNKKKLYPIRLNLRMRHIYNKITIFTYVYQGNDNSPVFQSSINEFVVNSNDMTNSINAVYDQYLQSNKNRQNKSRLKGSKFFGMANDDQLNRISLDVTFSPFIIKEDKFKMFVINASYNTTGPSDGYHITFVERFRHEHVIFSQFYNNNLFHVNLYSLNTGELLNEHQNSDVNVLWKSIGLFQKYSGRQLFLLENAEMKQIIEKTIIFQVSCSEWDPIIFDKLHSTYMKHFYSKEFTLSVLIYLSNKKSTLFELNNLLYKFNIIEKNDSNFNETTLRKIRAWRQLLKASGCKQIKANEDNEYWSKADDIAADLEVLELFYEIKSNSDSNTQLNLNKESDSSAKIFWKSFENAMSFNKRGPDGQQRILSIIAEKFSYSELENHLNISNNLITAARKYAQIYGEGAPISQEDRVKITRNNFSDDQLNDLETFLHDKNNVSMSSYKTDTLTGNPILYLKATKKEMWEKYHEEYPNGLKRTSFMCRLDGQFKYKEDLGGLCITCDFYGYQVFDSLTELISASNIYLAEKNYLIDKIELLKRHLKRGLDEEIKVLNNGHLQHTSCLNHCLLYAFGECKEEHDLFCRDCISLFLLLNEIKEIALINMEKYEEYLDKILYYLSHQLRKIYLNSQFNAALRELTHNGAVLVCDYKMKVNPKSSRETKQNFFGKEGWTLHTILVITKSNVNNELIVRAFDHWSDDGKQDAYFTASAFDAVLPKLGENIEWIRIFSDNGGHYHNSELMVIVSYWKKWYNLSVTSWQFLEPGEAKTIVDSHHAKLSHGFIRYTRLGNSISTGEDIVNSNKTLAGTYFAKLIPDRGKKISVGTIPGISNYFTFMWPTGEKEGTIEAYEIPHYGSSKIYSVSHIKRLLKNNDIKQPDSIEIDQTAPQMGWKMNIPSQIDPSIQKLTVAEVRSKLKENNLDSSGDKLDIKWRLDQFSNNNKINHSLLTIDNTDLKNLLDEKLIPGFALRSKQKFGKRGGKKLDLKVVEKLKEMFLAGNIEKSNKFSPEDMLKNLNICVENNELETDNIPSHQQIKSWISRFNQHHKKQAAEIASSI